MKDLILGLDLGTSSIKAGVFALDGEVVAQSQMPQHVDIPKSGWAEQDPVFWWYAVQHILREVVSEMDAARIAAIGLCGQCPGHVLVDEKGEPLHQAIIWRDQRAQEEVEWLCANISLEQTEKWLGTHFVADPSLPPARLLWLKKNRPEDWRKAQVILQPKDFIGYKLTGEIGTDRNSAYILANAHTGKYEEAYFNLLGVPIEKLPPVLDEETAVLGEITRQAAVLTGLLAGTPVVVGTIDAWCDNLAGGAVFDNRAVDVCGTSEMVSMGTNIAVSSKKIFNARIGKEVDFLVGPAQVGGETLRWFAKGFFPEMERLTDFAVLEKEASKIEPGSDGLVFLPYLSGERAPIWDANAKGCFIGLTLEHTRSYCVRAVYEGVAFAVRHILEAIEEETHRQAEFVVACGGGSQSQFWNQIKANVFQRPVVPTNTSQSASLGAAILAAVGTGLFNNISAASKSMIRLMDSLEPNPGLAQFYERNYAIYQGSYLALKDIFENQYLVK